MFLENTLFSWFKNLSWYWEGAIYMGIGYLYGMISYYFFCRHLAKAHNEDERTRNGCWCSRGEVMGDILGPTAAKLSPFLWPIELLVATIMMLIWCWGKPLKLVNKLATKGGRKLYQEYITSNELRQQISRLQATIADIQKSYRELLERTSKQIADLTQVEVQLRAKIDIHEKAEAQGHRSTWADPTKSVDEIFKEKTGRELGGRDLSDIEENNHGPVRL